MADTQNPPQFAQGPVYTSNPALMTNGYVPPQQVNGSASPTQFSQPISTPYYRNMMESKMDVRDSTPTPKQRIDVGSSGNGPVTPAVMGYDKPPAVQGAPQKTAFDAYRDERLATDTNYQRELHNNRRRGMAGYGGAQTEELKAKYEQQYRNEWSKLSPDQRAEKANDYVANGVIGNQNSVDTSRIRDFRAYQKTPTAFERLNGLPAGAGSQTTTYKTPDQINQSRSSMGLTNGTTQSEIDQNRAILQHQVDLKKQLGIQSQVGNVLSVETNSPTGNIYTQNTSGVRMPNADAFVAKNQEIAQQQYNNRGDEYLGDRNNQVMSGKAFNEMQDRMATPHNPAQHTNDQNVFVSYRPDTIGGTGQWHIQGGSNNVPGYTTPMTVGDTPSGYINGVPGKQAIADQIKTNEKIAVPVAEGINQKEGNGLKMGTPIMDMLQKGNGPSSPNPYSNPENKVAGEETEQMKRQRMADSYQVPGAIQAQQSTPTPPSTDV